MTDKASRALSPHDATEWKYAQDPRISPSGERVAFTLMDVARPDEHDRSAIWMLDLISGEAKRFTFGSGEDSAPRWSPDGKTLAFLSDRLEPGKKQIFVISTDGGEARQLTNWKGGVSHFAWSPNGMYIAFTAKDPKSEEEEKREKERRDEIVRGRNIKYGRLYLVPAEGGEPRRISSEGRTHVLAFDWLPDSSGIIAAHVPSPSADDEFTGPSNVVCYSMSEGAEARTLFELNTGLEQPVVSPDGCWLAYRSKAGRVTIHDQIWIIPMESGEPRLLTNGYKGTVDRIV